MAALFDRISHLPYLDAVVREALRLYAPITTTMRVATQDDVIPFAEPFVDKHGIEQTELRVARGDAFVVPIRILNRSTEIWGDDAEDFKPERWDNLPEKVASLPGIYSNLLTFSAGPRVSKFYFDTSSHVS